MKTAEKNIIDLFESAKTTSEYEQVKELMKLKGYSGFSQFLYWMKEQLKSYDESNALSAKELLNKAITIFPNPKEFSPSWVNEWIQLEKIMEFKNEVLTQVPQEKRDGEWQVVMDNPYTNEAVVCYPALSFIEAAYLYGFFRLDLKNNEYIRMQKVEELIVFKGNDEDKHI
ncbi:hypothetical protein [Chengkuizengella axinellae]|uniref:Uncharacterized protein n=1 Tax=Chengkuizengella axinellae TaxID=3064388 RepID=A0ABT9IXS8_9BACL|nr:hypothetical protein [Chengkuizengella sp. 2205SS18-9]MDP5274130.1 hypothetical protein [Chengkuizengella sp. 2205SS18-9]